MKFTSSPPAHLAHIQVLRWLAATLVVLGHAKHEAEVLAGPVPASAWSLVPTALLAGGVDIFFVISGLIMYTVSSQEFGRPGAPVHFMVRRLARIVPAYWLFTAAVVAAGWLVADAADGARPTAHDIVGSLLFIPYRDAQGMLYPLLALGWTLNFEMLFYAVFALGLTLPRRAGLVAIAVVMALLALLGLTQRLDAAPLAFWCQPIVLEFLFGVLLGILRTRGWRLTHGSAWALAWAGFTALAMLGHHGASHPLDPARVLWMGLPALAIGAAAALSAQPARPGPFMHACAAGGDASYALYLSHPFVLKAIVMLWPGWVAHNAGPFVVVAYGACLGLALWFHRVVEKPMTRSLATLLTRANAATREPLPRRKAGGSAR